MNLVIYDIKKKASPLNMSLLLPDGSVVSVSDSWPGGCEFNPRLRRTFFPAYFRLSPLEKHVRKVALEKKVVLVLVWESQETHVCHRPLWYDISC